MTRKEKSIELFTRHYYYVKDVVDRIDRGEDILADSVAGRKVGERQHCVDEANIAVDRLAELGNFELTKIE